MTTPASQALIRKTQIIMKRWEERARKEITSAYGTASLSMRNALPRHLDQLASALSASGEKTTAQIAITTTHQEGIGKEHGRDRANTAGYSIHEVIFEYRILRQVIIQTLEEEIPLSAVEREIITDLIEQAVNDAAVEFSEAVRDMSDQFTATLTHDLRGPLTAAMASAELIQARSDRPELCAKNATFIIGGLVRMDSMIQNLLDAGRIRAGQGLSVHLTECDPVEIAKELIADMFAVYGARIVLSAPDKLQTWWSRDLFCRALENLMSNAVKYGDPEAPVTVSLLAENDTVKVTVHNSGNPIVESEKAVLFQNYRRSMSAESGAKRGWGLGLTLVSGVVQAHGGSVQVESSEEKGTSFIMILPRDCRSPSAAPL